MNPRPICEPVDLGLDGSVVVDRVVHGAGAPGQGRLLHFHDVAELVIFRSVTGWFYAEGSQYPLHANTVVFVPSMYQHDFLLEGGAKSWWLIQIDPYLVERLSHQVGGVRLTVSLCASPSAEDFERLDMLAAWLESVTAANPSDPLATTIVELILSLAARAPIMTGTETRASPIQIDRFVKAIDALRRDPGASLSLRDAAGLCNLSSTYFSRRFKDVFGINFTDYARNYRLHIAARRIASTRLAISEIAYALGFTTPSHFSQRFQEHFGVSPRAYRQAVRG